MALTATARVSIIVPVHNSAATIETCLRPLVAHAPAGTELIIVDDRSSDEGPALAAMVGARVVRNDHGPGPAGARNAGAAIAAGEILFFIDADVIGRATTIQDLLETFDRNPGVAAVFGSYDDEPTAPNFLSQYRNLLHHFTHQEAREDSSSFWAGCGAIRADVFRALGGFDERQFPRPSAEDIELGMRLRAGGYHVRLDKMLQVTHAKRWTWISLLRTDIMQRAYPWTKLILKTGRVPDDLNLRFSHRASAILVGLLAAMIPFLALGHKRFYGVPVGPVAIVTVLLLLGNIIALNQRFYRFLAVRRGWPFAALSIPMHLLYYFYSGVVFLLCWTYERARRMPRKLWHAGRSAPPA